jgi:hypothetical protein
MAEIFTPSRAVRSPTAAELQIARPVLGRTATSLFSGMTGLHGSRLKRAMHSPIVMAMAPAPDDSGTASTLRYDYRFPFVSSPYATHLWLGMWLVAEEGQSTPPEVKAEIYDEAGVLIDAGVTWIATDGSLPLAPRQDDPFAGAGNRGVLAVQDDFIETGWAEASEVAGGPRLLQLGDPGTWHELRLSPVGTRLYSASAQEADRGRIRRT